MASPRKITENLHIIPGFQSKKNLIFPAGLLLLFLSKIQKMGNFVLNIIRYCGYWNCVQFVLSKNIQQLYNYYGWNQNTIWVLLWNTNTGPLLKRRPEKSIPIATLLSGEYIGNHIWITADNKKYCMLDSIVVYRIL